MHILVPSKIRMNHNFLESLACVRRLLMIIRLGGFTIYVPVDVSRFSLGLREWLPTLTLVRRKLVLGSVKTSCIQGAKITSFETGGFFMIEAFYFLLDINQLTED